MEAANGGPEPGPEGKYTALIESCQKVQASNVASLGRLLKSMTKIAKLETVDDLETGGKTVLCENATKSTGEKISTSSEPTGTVEAVEHAPSPEPPAEPSEHVKDEL